MCLANQRYIVCILLYLCSVNDFETTEKDWAQGSLSILHFDPSTFQGEVTAVTHNATCLFAVGVALDRRSDVSVQLKAAIAVEILDYIVQSRWSPEVHMC